MYKQVSNQQRGSKRINVSSDSVVRFLRLSRVKEPDGRFYVGREDTSTYLHLDEKFAEIIRLCDGVRSLQEVVEIYADYNNYSKEQEKELLKEAIVLIQKLVEYRFVFSVDGKILEAMRRGSLASKVMHKPMLHYLFSPLAFVFIFTFFLMAINVYYFRANIFVGDTTHFPKPRDMFWHPSFSISLVTGILASWLFLYKHELFHLIAAKTFGVNGEVRLSKRVIFLVAETRLKDLYKLSRSKRVIIYLAGIASDALVITCCLVFLLLRDKEIFVYRFLVYSLLKQFILLSWQSILWQFKFFVQTDIYALVEDISGCDKLLFLTRVKVKLFFHRLFSIFTLRFANKIEGYNRIVSSNLFLRAQPVMRWYIWFFFIGMVFALVQFSFYQIPIAFVSIKEGIDRILLGYYAGYKGYIVDGVTVLFFQFNYWGLLFYVYIRDAFSSQRKSDIKI